MPRTALLLATLLMAMPTGARAQAGPLEVALSGEYMPLHGGSKAGMIGFEADLARALGLKLGREVEFVDTRKAFGLGTIEAVEQGKVDLGLNFITPTEERAQKVDFTEPYLKLAYRLAGKAPALTGALDQMAVKVAAPSALVRAAVAEAMPKATILVCKGMRRCIWLVLDGRAELVEQGGRLVRPLYCYAESPATHFEKRKGSWEVYQLLGQDSQTGRIQRARRIGRDKIRLKASMGTYGPNIPLVMTLQRIDDGHWRCDHCHPAVKDFTTEARKSRYPVHDYDADSRDATGDCGPP